MRFVRVASAVAIILFATIIVPPSASALHGSGSIVAPGPGGDLDASDVVRLRFGPSAFPLPPPSSGLLHGVVHLDSVAIGWFNRTYGGSANNTTVEFDVPVQVPSNMTSRTRLLTAQFTLGNETTTAYRDVEYVGGPPNAPPTLTITEAHYVVGAGFSVSGTWGDDDSYVPRITFNTTYGTSTAWFPNATWTVIVPVNPTQLGAHWMRITATDGMLTAQRDLVVDVVGEPVTLWNETLTLTPVGLLAAPSQIPLPPRILDGDFSVSCASSPCPAIVEGYVEADSTEVGCGSALGVLNSHCEFTTHDGSGQITLAWIQGGGSVRVSATGVRV